MPAAHQVSSQRPHAAVSGCSAVELVCQRSDDVLLSLKCFEFELLFIILSFIGGYLAPLPRYRWALVGVLAF